MQEITTYKQLKDFIIEKKHRALRRDCDFELANEFSLRGLTPSERMTERFERMCNAETPVVFPCEKIAFIRTVKNLPTIFTDKEWQNINDNHYIHELGFVSNVCADYAKILNQGLLKIKETANSFSARSIDALIELSDRYSIEAEKVGNYHVSEMLKRVPRYGARNFNEALQLFRIVHFGLWLEGNYHVTVGSFDRYMYPFYKNDIENGTLTKDQAYMLVEEFFLSFNRDSDLYPGVQQGDNGQSIVLGGLDEHGNETFNDLSEFALKASAELLVIDPKINLRVSSKTPLRVYELGSRLTKFGLGFPQYTNDDLAIPALEKLGYSHKDACSYVMAACWELIIPGVGTDIANISALSFIKVIDNCLHNDLIRCDNENEFLDAVKAEIIKQCDKITSELNDIWFIPSPFMNVCMTMPISDGGKYNNFGIHGSGVANASDSICAIVEHVYNNKSVTKEELIKAVDENFVNSPELLHKLRYETPKVGNNDDKVDKYLVFLISEFSKALSGKTNCRGGIYRAGTGTAMYYLRHADEIGASPDGRRKGEPLGANYAVSLFAKSNGPLSVLQSLNKPNFLDAFNGGPVTLEFASSMWQGKDTELKFARFVKNYIDMGGHQIQFNTVNADKLRDAQIRPELYERLIVRIWGWSAYFTELDKEYQDHVILRQEYTI